ncbi:TonB-dependent receptor [Gynurincola endophyticus]|uniref:TonB-dependent receptor n=1 Tax=Gynurincola endophyticus TaxID=2479004 RepID=UPI000F8DF1E5|nr:TonB-dependent receptor plug domain-containing protein [Gynurincola endophyticus]
MITKFFAILLCTTLVQSGLYLHAMPAGTTVAEQIVLTGKVLDANDSSLLAGAKITIKELGLETLSDEQGRFMFTAVPNIRITISVEHGQYLASEIIVNTSSTPINIYLKRNSVSLQEVVVIGVENNKDGVTSTKINRKAIEHLQATSLQEVLQLVPGAVVSNPSFSNVTRASIRQYDSDNLGSLGTAIVINGAALSNNANLQAINTATSGGSASFSTSSGSGIDLRTITADNIESVEVIRGIPSVEYGDLLSGAVIVKTKARKEPFQVKARFNPALTQFWAGKGIELKQNKGALFVDLDYTESLDSETNKYRNYKRLTGSAQYSRTIGARKIWFTNTTLALGYSRDKYEMDPDYIVDSASNFARDLSIRLSTNGSINFNKKFSRKLDYVLSANYIDQQGYQQQQYTADITAESYATYNTVLEVPYLRSTYLSRMWVNGKPLNLNGRISNSFYFLTGSFNHSVLTGVEYKMDANYGSGKTFSRPPRNTSGAAFRERAYNQIPALHQAAIYLQDKITKNIGDARWQLTAGLRYDIVQPFESAYHLSALSPRITSTYTLPQGITFRAAYGITSKAPTLLYLYPENAYYDFYSLNHYTTNPNERLALIATRVYNSQNRQLQLTKNTKLEAGVDIELKMINPTARLSLTTYKEHTNNGYSMSTTLESVQFSRYPVYTVAERPVDQKPALSNVVETNTRFVSYFIPTNNINRINKGVEFDLDLGRFNSINTSFNISGAYTLTKSTSNNHYIFQQNLADRATTRIGVFAAGRGAVSDRFITTVRAIHNIPQLGFVVTLVAQTIWKDAHEYVGYNAYPIGYIPFDKEGNNPVLNYLTPKEIAEIDPVRDADIYLNINDAIFLKESWKPLWLFNLKLTKEFKNGLNFSFFANNVINNRPLQTSTRYPTIYTKRNIPIFFGSEISIKL